MAAKKKAKKKASKKKALATKAGVPALPWQQALAKHAEKGKAPKEKATSTDFISTKGAKFSIGNKVIGRELDCFVLAWGFENSYFDSDYVEGESSAPACFAIGYDEDTMSPHEKGPNKQCETSCDECWADEWGSGRGDGKACGNRRRLVLVVEGEDGNPEMKMLRIAPTSIGNWKKFVNDLEAMGLHTMQAAVNIHFDEDSTAAYPPLVFDFVDEVTDESWLQAMSGLLESAEKLIEQPFDVSNYTAPSKGKKSKKKASKKKVSKKKTSRRSKLS